MHVWMRTNEGKYLCTLGLHLKHVTLAYMCAFVCVLGLWVGVRVGEGDTKYTNDL